MNKNLFVNVFHLQLGRKKKSIKMDKYSNTQLLLITKIFSY